MKSSIFALTFCPVGIALVLTALPASAATVMIVADRDTALFAAGSDNNLGAADLVAGTAANGQSARSLFSFDIAANVPAGSTINSVTFSIGVIRQSNLNQPSSYELHRFLKDWSEGSGTGNMGSAAANGDTTWNSQFHGNTLWSSPGGQAGDDYISSFSGVGSVIDFEDFLYQISSSPGLVSDVQGWLDTPATNEGWMFIATSEGTNGTARRFSSTEVTGAVTGFLSTDLSPRIVVNFTAVPEPATAFLAGFGMLALLRRRRF